MTNLGNVTGIIYTSYPAQWDDVYVCHADKVKILKRVYDDPVPDYSYLRGYGTVREKPDGK